MPPPTTVELLWGATQRPKRGPKPALTLDGIVAEAITLVDADGLSALSMQRLAERLGFTKMSLYRYVPGKEQLTALMVDAAIGRPPATPPGQSWRPALRRWAEEIFERYRAHPWVIELTLGARPLGPNEMAWTEVVLAALDGTGLTGAERLDTIVLLNGHVRGLAQQSLGADADQLQEQVTGQLADTVIAAGDRFPHVRAAFTDVDGGAAGGEGALSFGIERILDGLDVLIARRADR
ncbi:TetR/AcrR family transcriptional regulator [Nocardia sp. NPDC058176]|uniref:TetR/AcrR family transcriptional regulator n=1 Tax=Nocardia sp. NPDC058176 TaxID=3346368 RepID=UPI0036DE9EBE